MRNSTFRKVHLRLNGILCRESESRKGRLVKTTRRFLFLKKYEKSSSLPKIEMYLILGDKNEATM